MANLIRRRESEPSATMTRGRIDPFRTFRALLQWDPFGRDMSRLLDPLADLETTSLQGEAVFFARSFTLPEGADLERVKADLDQGVLTLIVPKEASQARRIEVGSKGEQKGELRAKSEQGAAPQTSAAKEEPAASAKEAKEQASQRKAA